MTKFITRRNFAAHRSHHAIIMSFFWNNMGSRITYDTDVYHNNIRYHQIMFIASSIIMLRPWGRAPIFFALVVGDPEVTQTKCHLQLAYH